MRKFRLTVVCVIIFKNHPIYKPLIIAAIEAPTIAILLNKIYIVSYPMAACFSVNMKINM